MAIVDTTIQPPMFSTGPNGGALKWIQSGDDHGYEVVFVESATSPVTGLTATFNGITYNLWDFHFHTTSEHTHAGGSYDAEIHMVHKAADTSKIMVIGIWLQVVGDTLGQHINSDTFPIQPLQDHSAQAVFFNAQVNAGALQTLVITSISSGQIYINMPVVGHPVIPKGCLITAITSGTLGGPGSYTISYPATAVVPPNTPLSAGFTFAHRNSFIKKLQDNQGGYPFISAFNCTSDATCRAEIEIPEGELPFNPYATIRPGSPAFYTYTGSLTTPPCTEGVTWVMMAEPVPISKADLIFIRQNIAGFYSTRSVNFGESNRPVQPLNGRSVYYSPGFTIAANSPSGALAPPDSGLVLGALSFTMILIALLYIVLVSPRCRGQLSRNVPTLDTGSAATTKVKQEDPEEPCPSESAPVKRVQKRETRFEDVYEDKDDKLPQRDIVPVGGITMSTMHSAPVPAPASTAIITPSVIAPATIVAPSVPPAPFITQPAPVVAQPAAAVVHPAIGPTPTLIASSATPPSIASQLKARLPVGPPGPPAESPRTSLSRRESKSIPGSPSAASPIVPVSTTPPVAIPKAAD